MSASESVNSPSREQPGGLFNLPRDSRRNIVIVAVLLSLICSILVSGTAVLLRPKQLNNEKINRQKIILEVAGLLGTDSAATGEKHSDSSLDTLFERVEAHVVELASGDYDDELDPETFDAQRASRDATLSSVIPASEDIANIGQRANFATVYLVRDAGKIQTIILPVYGYGLWSTMYGFIALESDANTVAGLRFYQQAETPGLGGEVDNPKWRAQWKGKLVFDEQGEVKIEVIRGNVVAAPVQEVVDPSIRYQIDGLAGSTLTGIGVNNLMRYWLGPEGFGPFLKRLKKDGDLT